MLSVVLINKVLQGNIVLVTSLISVIWQKKTQLNGNWFILTDSLRRSTWWGRHGSQEPWGAWSLVSAVRKESVEKNWINWIQNIKSEIPFQVIHFYHLPIFQLLKISQILKMVPLTGREAYRTHKHEEHFTFKLQAWNSTLSIFIRNILNQNSPFIASMKNTNLFCQDTVEVPTSRQNISTSYQLMKL